MSQDVNQPSAEDFDNIRNKCIDYLARQGFSEKKLLRKITDLKKNYPHSNRYRYYTPKYVQKVLEELKGEGIINEREYALDVLRQLKDKKDGIRRIREKMYRRLIDPLVVQEVLKNFEEEGRHQDFDRIVKEVLRKKEDVKRKIGHKKNREFELTNKLYAFLAQKGYLPDDIALILKRAEIKPTETLDD